MIVGVMPAACRLSRSIGSSSPCSAALYTAVSLCSCISASARYTTLATNVQAVAERTGSSSAGKAGHAVRPMQLQHGCCNLLMHADAVHAHLRAPNAATSASTHARPCAASQPSFMRAVQAASSCHPATRTLHAVGRCRPCCAAPLHLPAHHHLRACVCSRRACRRQRSERPAAAAVPGRVPRLVGTAATCARC